MILKHIKESETKSDVTNRWYLSTQKNLKPNHAINKATIILYDRVRKISI